MTDQAFVDKVQELAEGLGVPGVSAAVIVDGQAHYAYVGVTSLENPLPVDENTLFQFGSTGKTFTATAIMRLVEQGRVSLSEPVRTYVPELVLKDEDVAARVTVLNLLNHTAGWDGDLFEDQGAGDDALTKYVARMATIEQVTGLNETVSYNNAALSLAGQVIAKVTGTSYEAAMKELVFEPLGLQQTFFFADDVMTRRFSVGHNILKEGEAPSVARPWHLSRGNWPAGGMSATARDQIAWAQLHLGDGHAADGSVFLAPETIASLQQPTADMAGSALGDAVGISWLLGSFAGVPTVGHGGTTTGQHSEFVMVPSRGFALISMTNCGPNGPVLNEALRTWAYEHYLGLVEAEPTLASLPAEELAGYEGSFETIAALVHVTSDAEHGRLVANIELKPEAAAQLHESGEDVPEQPPIPLALIEGKSDHYVVPEGDAKGMKGYFSRASDGTVDGVHLGGRLATRVAAPVLTHA